VSHDERVRVAAVVIAAAVMAMGGWGLVASRGMGITEPDGVLLGWRAFEAGLLTLNPLGAGLTLAVGALALAGAFLRRWVVVAAAAVVLLVMAAQVLVQWGGTPNALGSRGSNLSFWSGAGIGLATLATAAAWSRQPGRSVRPGARRAEGAR
jgi:hypothetical protein